MDQPAELSAEISTELFEAVNQAFLPSRQSRSDRSRTMGEYYRDLSCNYNYYEKSGRWPSPPYPPENHVTLNF